MAGMPNKVVWICLTPDCGSKKRSRGLCWKCYNRMRIKVKAGKISWFDLETTGKCLAKADKEHRGGYIWRISHEKEK